MKLIATETAYKGNDLYVKEYEIQGAVSLRDYFAGQALTGIFSENVIGVSYEDICQAAYKAADAMLAERNKEREE